MNIYDINKDTIRSISNKELILIHYRVHQLYGTYKNKKSQKIDKLKIFLKKAHVIIMDEMKNRDLNHSSIIKYLKNINST